MTRQMLVLELCCPQCRATLTEGTRVRLDGHVRRTHQQGEFSLSAVFGEDSAEAGLALEAGDVVDLSCPRCEASLMLPLACKICGAAMASLNLAQGGALEFCTRRGCKAHALGGAGNIDDMMSLMNRMFETPYD
ncbi:MAG TPA: hypothetical protein PLL32_02100 [Anaeromyxobacteraceae bacterium]|nr:hypothetical protein [Anaeromyxobacteraceae bacterium]